MSAVEPKVRNVGFGWEAIDIYMFSNGQKSSPPRKYHLRMDELDWWEATLNQLAKSHYGSSHTAIELYTISGNKIEGPRELSDGMPCVAVMPPDTFTDAGYEKYLMRASRSFEKRKAKNANVDQSEDIVPDALQIDNEKPQLVYATDIETSNGPEKNVAASSVTINSQKSIMQKSDLTDPQLPRNINAPSSNNRNEKRHSNMARTSFMKAHLQSRKNSKQDSQMKTPKRSLKKNDTGVAMLTDKSKGVSNYLNQNEMSEKSLLASPPSGITSVTTTKPSISAIPGKCHTMLTVNSQDFVTDPLPLQDLISGKKILVPTEESNLFRNPVPEVKSGKLDACFPPVVDEITEFSQTYVDEEIQTKVEITSCEVTTATRKYSSPSNSKIIVIPATIASQSNIMKCDVPLGDNCIAVINKGDAVNLTLQIELQNGSSHTNNQSNSNLKNPRETRSLSNLFKKRKSDHSGDQAVAPTKSLESVICGINECYTKVVVVQCSCCGNKTTVPRVDTVPVYKDPNGFFILMPTTAQGITSCLCCRNHQKQCTDNRAMSALCVEELCKPKSSTTYPCVQEVGMVMTLTGSFGSQTEKRQSNGADTCIMAKRILGNMMSINKDRCTVDEYGTSPSRVIQRLEYIVSTANMPRALPCERVESYTQTEWCSILLEAQRHEDGRYSFHFPSLQVLKYYSLI